MGKGRWIVSSYTPVFSISKRALPNVCISIILSLFGDCEMV